MLKNGEAYLKINTFGQTTAAEVKRHLSDLDSEGMTSLVLDLRDNPGGSFPAAIDVASLFLKKGQEVVSIRGRYAGIVRRYNVSRDGKYANVPMAVLLNLGSASASEIVAGALQDHDRALVVGQRSWGKGLVQTLTPLENQGAVAITTARYYTPSGRLIQRDYSKSYDAYYFPEEQPERVKEETKTEEKQEEKFTDAGRPVFGGGGIAPDIKVEAGKIPPLALKLERRRAYLNFVAHKVETGQMDAKTAESPELVAEFKAYIEKQGDAFTPEEWKASQTYTRCALAREALTMLEGQAAGFKAMIPLDNQLLKAESLLLQPGSDKKRAA
jgi:carboxyl-terminal processing protease